MPDTAARLQLENFLFLCHKSFPATARSSGIHGSSLTSDSAKRMTKQPKKSVELVKGKMLHKLQLHSECPDSSWDREAHSEHGSHLSFPAAGWAQRPASTKREDQYGSVPHQLRIFTSPTSPFGPTKAT